MPGTFLHNAETLGKSAWHFLLALCVCAAAWRTAAAGGDDITFKRGHRVPGIVLQQRGDSVVLRVQRSEIAAINGRPLPPPVDAGAQAPPFRVVDLNGATQTLPDPQGSSTLLAFWATWCPHCRTDVPLLTDLFNRYHERGLRVLAVSIDHEPDAVRRFVQEHHLPYPVVIEQAQSAAAGAGLSEQFDADGVPTYVLVDARGVIAYLHAGSVIEGQVDMAQEVQRVLTSAAPAKRTTKGRRR